MPGLPTQAVRQILSRAEGVPLYAVETVRMLLNQGRLIEQDGVYEPIGDLTRTGGPELAPRADRRPPRRSRSEDRSVLQDASILGRRFTPSALAGISGRPADELEPRLRSLVRREVLELNADPRSPERGQYGVRAGPGPRSRLLDPFEAGSTDAAPRRGALLRGAGRR